MNWTKTVWVRVEDISYSTSDWKLSFESDWELVECVVPSDLHPSLLMVWREMVIKVDYILQGDVNVVTAIQL